MPIKIPEAFMEKLRSDKSDKDYEGHINQLLKNTKQLIGDRAVFFPKYTLHGWQHVQGVLNQAKKLIPETVMEQLTPRDIALLISAVVLHDLGMFLTEAGGCKLLTEKQPMPFWEFDKQAQKDNIHTWNDAWKRYIRRVRRYSKEQRLYQFGTDKIVTELHMEKGSLNELDRIIIGEFLREQHHMLALKIALNVMPGDTDRDVMPFEELDRRCIGILACSHGMPIRDTWKYIEEKISTYDIPLLTYLMAVVRMADLLEAGEHRVPEILRDLEGINVPASVREWAWNRCIIKDDREWEKMQDSKFIRADPQSTTEFVQMERWLNEVQQELDCCWAVMAEKKMLDQYSLSIHRIHSNILEAGQRKTYGKRFITREARLTADPEILKLMIAPLYGEDPNYGIRELIQNAADACREREYLEHNGGDKQYKGEITVSLDTVAKKFVIEDNGIGMDEETLLKYYLVAGASCRSSDRWLNDFADGKSAKIIRTGKFGVGALAGFLLGERITVQTRRMNTDLGYSFSMSMDENSLNIKRVGCEVGTKITIELNKRTCQIPTAHYDNWCLWYAYRKPVIKYNVNGVPVEPKLLLVPSCTDEKDGWFEYQTDAGYQVFWKQMGSRYDPDYLYVNGIRILEGCEEIARKNEPPLPAAGVSIVDMDNHLELDLSRNHLLDDAVLQQVRKEQFKYFLANLLTIDFSSREIAVKKIGCIFCDISEDYLEQSFFDLLYAQNGYSLLYAPFIEALKVNRVLHIDLETEKDKEQRLTEISKLHPTIPIVISCLFLSGGIHGLYNRGRFRLGGYLSMASTCRAVSVWQRKEDPNLRPDVWRPDYELERIPVWENREYKRFGMDMVKGDETDAFSVTALKDTKIPIIAELEVKGDCERNLWMFHSLIRDFFGDDPWIPYDMEERRKKFPKAFKKLKYYIDRIEQDRKKK